MNDKVKLPHADFEISRLIFGCWAVIGGFNWGHQDKKDSLEAMREAFNNGISTFDTAEAYGNGASENLLAEALGDKRKEMIIASKVGPQDFLPEDVIKACEKGLKNLKTDYIDLYQLHWPNPDIPLVDTLGALQKLKDDGKIRAYGVSNFGNQSLDTCRESGFTISSNQMAYNLIFRAIEYSILPQCVADNVPILCYSPIMQGLLTGKFDSAEQVPDDRARTRHFSKDRSQARHQDEGCEALTFQVLNDIKKFAEEINVPMGNLSLAWLLAQKGVAAPIVGGRNADQVRKNLKTMEVKLTADMVNHLNEISLPLKERLGTNADLWQSGGRVI